jgi:hypothetical protein
MIWSWSSVRRERHFGHEFGCAVRLNAVVLCGWVSDEATEEVLSLECR